MPSLRKARIERLAPVVSYPLAFLPTIMALIQMVWRASAINARTFHFTTIIHPDHEFSNYEVKYEDSKSVIRK